MTPLTHTSSLWPESPDRRTFLRLALLWVGVVWVRISWISWRIEHCLTDDTPDESRNGWLQTSAKTFSATITEYEDHLSEDTVLSQNLSTPSSTPWETRLEKAQRLISEIYFQHIPRDIQDLMREWIIGLLIQESRFTPDSISTSFAYGIGQMKLDTALDLGAITRDQYTALSQIEKELRKKHTVIHRRTILQRIESILHGDLSSTESRFLSPSQKVLQGEYRAALDLSKSLQWSNPLHTLDAVVPAIGKYLDSAYHQIFLTGVHVDRDGCSRDIDIDPVDLWVIREKFSLSDSQLHIFQWLAVINSYNVGVRGMLDVLHVFLQTIRQADISRLNAWYQNNGKAVFHLMTPTMRWYRAYGKDASEYGLRVYAGAWFMRSRK